jgi:putative membrane protein insertion efficiency factor
MKSTQWFIAPIKAYQYISKMLPSSCRYYPSCSHYGVWQFDTNRADRAFLATVARILRCNQLFRGGIDYPVIVYKPKPLLCLCRSKIRVKYWFVPKKNNRYYVIKDFDFEENMALLYANFNTTNNTGWLEQNSQGGHVKMDCVGTQCTLTRAINGIGKREVRVGIFDSNDQLVGSYSSSELFTVTLLAIPQNLTATQQTDGILLTWGEVEGATTYTPYASIDNEKFVEVKSNEHDYSQNSYLFEHTAHTTFYFKIKADNGELSEAIKFVWVEETIEENSTAPINSGTSVVKKTGQTTSYTAYDDGDYQKGVAHSYTRDDAKEIVTDNVTGLMWQDNADASSIGKRWITKANWDARNYNDTSGDTATTYCSNLTLGGYSDWRLPASTELEGIVDYGRVNPSISPVFQNTGSDYYWSSTTNVDDSHYAWYVYFRYGHIHNGNKDDSRCVRCVRAGE